MKPLELKTDIIEPIITTLPPLGGMVPQDNSPQVVEQTLGKNIKIVGPEILATLTEITTAARDVGLQMTVNNVRRTIRSMLKIKESNDTDGTQQPLFPQLYKGVSFNPKSYSSLGGRTEWFMLLDFFSAMRALQKRFQTAGQEKAPVKFAVLDASLYWIVNLLGERGIKTNAETPEKAAKDILSQLQEIVQKNEGTDTYTTAVVRNAYLEAIAGQFPANMKPPVFNLLDVWNESGFEKYLAKALRLFCKRDETGYWKVKNPVKYKRYMSYSPWVTPLVAAETAVLADRYGFRANLAPTSEAAWNKILDQMCRKLKIPPYVIWGYIRTIAENLPYESIPTFSDTPETIKAKINSPESQTSGLPELLRKLVMPFINNGDNSGLPQPSDSVDLIQTFAKRIETKASEILGGMTTLKTRPLANTGWLMQFPAGTC